MGNRAVIIRCRVCGLEIIGVREADGTVRASNRVRPRSGQIAELGYCMKHAPANA